MIGVLRISARSSSVSGAGLEQDRVGHGDLADVVQQEAELDLRVVGHVEPAARAIAQPVGRDALGVLAGVGVARLDGVGQRADGRPVGARSSCERARSCLNVSRRSAA